MPFNPLIPQAPDLISVSQGQLLGNNTAIPVWQAVNHYEFGTGVNEGKHRFVTLPNQVAAPVPPFLANENAIYTFNYTPPGGGALAELWVHKQISGGTAEIPFTASILSQVAAPLINSIGWTYLPSGILMKWGVVTATANPTVVNLNALPAGTNSPDFIQIYNAQVSIFKSAGAVSTVPTGFSIKLVAAPPFQLQIGSPAPTALVPAYYWFVIGR